VIEEDGSELAAQLWGSSHPAAAGVLAYPEGRAALAAADRAGRLTPAAYRDALAGFEDVCAAALIVAVDDSLAKQAGDLAADHHLRGYDAVHLASALRLGPDTVLVTWDEQLNQAATNRGLAVAPAV
jgi:predicted nucleic acid-binding protein